MLNSKVKKENIKKLKYWMERYDFVIENTQYNCAKLCDIRLKGVKLIRIVEKYINTIANTPKSFEKDFSTINLNIDHFESILNDIKKEERKKQKSGGAMGAAGAMGAVGVTAFGPSIAMSIATTFGTASTGAAISSLSGAAATNAALAWLGGGALTAGGGGIAAGNALLALAGPLGWAIGGTAAAGSLVFASKKNKEIAEEAHNKTIEIEKMTAKFRAINKYIQELYDKTIEQGKGINKLYKKLSETKITDYNEFSQEEQYELGTLVNNINAFSSLLNKTLEEREDIDEAE